MSWNRYHYRSASFFGAFLLQLAQFHVTPLEIELSALFTYEPAMTLQYNFTVILQIFPFIYAFVFQLNNDFQSIVLPMVSFARK